MLLYKETCDVNPLNNPISVGHVPKSLLLITDSRRTSPDSQVTPYHPIVQQSPTNHRNFVFHLLPSVARYKACSAPYETVDVGASVVLGAWLLLGRMDGAGVGSVVGAEDRVGKGVGQAEPIELPAE